MKTILRLLICAFTFFAADIMAQAPQKFNYQGVARNTLGNPLVNTSIGLQLSITDGVVALYTEQFTPTTNMLGLFNVEVGTGTVVSGTFAGIDWLNGAKHLKVEMDPAGGTSYTDLGSSQLVSVPYALVAEKASNMGLNDLNDVNTSGAVTNQVLQWNGAEWVPANVGGGGSDNWGSQSVVTNADISGNGTSGNPITIAQQGATNGQVLQWGGTAWLPATISGDNWGSQSVVVSSQFNGNGTSINPLVLAQQGAINDDVLKWSGTSWIPGTDETFSLPYSGTVVDIIPAFEVINAGPGTGIRGTNSSSSNNAYGVMGFIQNSSPGMSSSAVLGTNYGTNGNGFGVCGTHGGSGIGTYGSAVNGIGVQGFSTGAAGIGVLGLGGSKGVSGTSNTASGIGVYGNATSGGYGGWFDGRTVIASNSNATDANLSLIENEASDYNRLRMVNLTPGNFWEINALNTGTGTTEYFNIWNESGGALLTVRGDGNVGVGVTNPTQKLDVAGNVKFSGALMPNNLAGTSGQVLISNGAGTPPSWGSSTNTLYNNTYLWDHTNTPGTLSGIDQPITYNGVTDLNFNVSGNSKVIVNFNQPSILGGGGDSQLRFRIQIRDNLNNIVNQSTVFLDLRANKSASVSSTHHCLISTPGTYKVNVQVAVQSGPTNVTIFTAPGEQGQVNVQVIPQ